MATLQEKQAESLAVLKEYQDAHGENLVIHGADTLGRTHTERLVNSGYLKMVIKGWSLKYCLALLFPCSIIFYFTTFIF